MPLRFCSGLPTSFPIRVGIEGSPLFFGGHYVDFLHARTVVRICWQYITIFVIPDLDIDKPHGPVLAGKRQAQAPDQPKERIAARCRMDPKLWCHASRCIGVRLAFLRFTVISGEQIRIVFLAVVSRK
jgi:hypothetical protein